MAKSHNNGSVKAIYGNYPRSDDAEGVADAAPTKASEARSNVTNGPQQSDKRDSCMP